MSPRRAALLLLALLCLAAPARAAPPRTDRYGDPLPDGAVARLGTGRLYQPGVTGLAFAPDGKVLAARDDFGDVRLWDVATGKELRRWPVLPPPFPPLTGAAPLAFSPDGKLLAVGGYSKEAHLFEAATGKRRHSVGLADRPCALAFSPDGRRLVIGDGSGAVRLWDVATGRLLRQWTAQRPLIGLAFAAGGKVVTTLSVDPAGATLAAWDADTGARRQDGRLRGAFHAALSPDARCCAVWRPDGLALRLLSATSGKELGRAEGDVFVGAGLAFSADGRTLTAASQDGVVRVWDAQRCKRLYDFRALSTSIKTVALSADGKLVALTGRADCAIHVWDTARGKELHAFAGHRGGPLAVAFSADGKAVLTADRHLMTEYGVKEWPDWAFRRWDAATGRELGATRATLDGEVHFTAFSADGRRLATVTHVGTLRVWDTAGPLGSLWRAKVPTLPVVVHEGPKTREAPVPGINDLAFAPDGRTLIAPDMFSVRRWATATGKELPPLKFPGRCFAHCLPAAEDEAVVNLNWTGKSWLVLLTDRPQKEAKGPPGFGESRDWFEAMALSPDGRTLATAEGDRVRLWEVGSRQERGRVDGPAQALAFRPDGRVLAAADKAGAVRLWDLSTGRALRALPGHADGAEERKHGMWGVARVRPVALAFAPDGGRLAVAGGENTVLVWDVAERALAKRPRPAPLSAEQLEALWAGLTGDDAAVADRAIWKLADAGPEGVAYVRRRLLEGDRDVQARVARLLAALDDDNFEVRERASAGLRGLGARAVRPLRQALAGKLSAEVRSRVQEVLARLERAGLEAPPTELFTRRAVEVLERSGTAEARQALRDLAGAATDARQHKEYQAALGRLARRPPPAR